MNDSYTSSVIRPQGMAAKGSETLERKAAKINESAYELDNILSEIKIKLFGPVQGNEQTVGRCNNCLEDALDIAVDKLSDARKMAMEILERVGRGE